MHLPVTRLVALAAGIAVVVSCDAGSTTGVFGSGISGGPTGTGPVTPPTGADTTDPFVRIDTPTTNQLVNVGDSIYVSLVLTDDRKIGSVTLTGFRESGDTALGTFVRTIRYTPLTAPAPGQVFQPGQTFARIRRYLQPAQPLDTTVGKMVIMAVATDSAGNVDTATVTVSMVTGPKVTILAPANGATVPRGVPMSVSVRATHTNGVSSVSIRVQGEATWPTLLDVPFTQTYPPGSRDVTLTGTLTIPADAPLVPPGRVTITASAIDVNSNPGTAAPVTAFVREAGSVAPSVCFAEIVSGQAVCGSLPDKLEVSDSVLVKADGDGITSVGIVIRDTLGNQVHRDSVVFPPPTFVSNVVQRIPLGLSDTLQGRRFDIIAFAYDNNTPPRVGFSMPTGTSTPITVEASAFAERTLITFGRTFAFPRSGTISDLAVDELRGNVFVSNTQFNLLEIWSNASKTFASSGVAVGALPWGLFIQADQDTLLVGNSGATTVSKVCINPTACAGGVVAEALAKRLRTRNTIIFTVVFTRDALTGKIVLNRLADVSYSDRPQYVVQSEGGRVFFSTRPTAAASPGTLRWVDPTQGVDPTQRFPDPRQIWQYGTFTPGSSAYAIFNADSIAILQSPPNSPQSDQLFIYDHVYGDTVSIAPVVDSMPADAATAVRLAGGDVEAILGLDVASLALTDTTFVAASGNRQWIGFGEGNRPGVGRIIMTRDSLGCQNPPTFLPGPCIFSPNMTVTDLVHNASERVFGMAIDRTGLQVTAHGSQTYVAALDHPFHLRLDGVYDSFDNGVGVTYHPNANSTLTPNDKDRVLFTATNSGIIEIVDVAHYNNRGSLETKNGLYGPLRATLPLPQDNAGLTCPGDSRCVVLKLYGLSQAGLVVIDLRATDIK